MKLVPLKKQKKVEWWFKKYLLFEKMCYTKNEQNINKCKKSGGVQMKLSSYLSEKVVIPNISYCSISTIPPMPNKSA